MKLKVGQRWRMCNNSAHVDYIIEVVKLKAWKNGIKGKLIQVIECDPMIKFIGMVFDYTIDYDFWIYLDGQDSP